MQSEQTGDNTMTADYPPPPSAPPSAELPASPPSPRRRGRARLLVIGLVVAVALGGIGAGAYVANASLSITYSPEKAVTDYFAAQRRGDVATMMANATFARGDGSFDDLFGQTALRSMMALQQNLDLRNVKVKSTHVIDDSSRFVTVSMTWNGAQRVYDYKVRKDPARVHYALYNSWRVEIPYVTIRVALPLQGGAITLDDLPLPPGATGAIQTIQGFHKVTMASNFLYDASSQVVDGTSESPAAKFDGTLSASAVSAAAKAVTAGFANCDAAKYTNCFGHTYAAPVKAYTIYYLVRPGYPEIDYNNYVMTLTSDPTPTMTLVVATEPGILSVSGPCSATMTVDGSRHYNFKGDFSGTLTWKDNAFTANIGWDCETAKA